MSETNNRAKRQLNPFAFPSETDARFILLMISALAMAISLASPLLEIVNPEASRNSYNFPAAPPEGLPSRNSFARNFAFGMQMAGISLKVLALPTSCSLPS